MATDTKKYVRIGSINFELDDLKGWSPILAVVNDGDRCVLQITNWTGGVGTKPATGQYLGVNGLVDNIADGTDIRGLRGSDGGGLQYQLNGVDVGSPTSFDTMNFIGNVQLTDDGNVLTVEILGSPDAVLSVNNVFPDIDGNVQLSPSDIGAEDTDNKRNNLEAPNNTTYPTTQAVVDGDAATLTDANEYTDNNAVARNAPIVGDTKTKITYDEKGLVIGGADATTADINDSTNRRYVSDSQLVVIGNTSGINTGNETTASIKSKLGAASASQDGYLASADWSTFNNKQNALTNIVTAGTYGSSTQIPVITVLANGLVDEITLANVAGGDAVLSATGTTLTLAAGVNYRILVSANTTIDCSALTGTVQFINVQQLNRTLTFTSSPQTVFDVTGSALTSVVLTGFTQAWLAPNPSVANSLRYTKHGQCLVSDMSWAATGSGNSSINRMSWSAASFSGARTYTLVDKDVNFGDLPNIGTTNGNNGSGTRPIILGCTSTTVAGTDNIAIGCFSCTVNGTSNLAQSCYNLTVPSNATNCVFINLHNDYTTPLSPLSFTGGILNNVEFSGWLNILSTQILFPKGYKVFGHKHRKVIITGITDVRSAEVDTEVALAATSSTSSAIMTCASDMTAYPTNFASGSQSYLVSHEVEIKGISEGSGYFIGKRRITYIWSGGAIQAQAIETIGTDRTFGTFTASITTASGTLVNSVYRLDIIVQNTANTQQVFWEATLKSNCQLLNVVI